MDREQRHLKKLFDVKQLPEELRYTLEHAQGIGAAAQSGNKEIMKRAVDDLIGTTVKQNRSLGWYGGGFEAQRNALMREIVAGRNVKSNIASLNKLAKEAYTDFGLKGNMYSLKGGKLSSQPISKALTETDRFASYFKEIAKTKEGAAAIKKQHGSYKNLINELRQGTVNFAKKIEGTEIARKICSAKANGGVAGCLNLAKKNPAKFMSRAIALGLAGELAAELAFAAPGYAAGKTGSELLGESIFGIFGAGTTFNEELAKYADPKAKEIIDLQEDISQLEKQASVIGASEAGLEGETELQERMMPGYLKGAESAVERLPIFEDPATTAAYSKAMEKYLAAQKERAKSLPRKAVSKVVEAIKTPFIEGIKDVGQSPGLFKSGGKVDYDNYLPDIDKIDDDK